MPKTSHPTDIPTPHPRLSPAELRALIDRAEPDATGETLAETRARLAGGILSPGGTDPRTVIAALRARRPGERGPQKAPVKTQVTLRIAADTLARFKATGPGWQTRIDDWLAKAPV